MNPIAPPSEPGKPLKKSAGGRPKKFDESSDPNTRSDLKQISSVATGHQYFVSKGGAVYRKLKTGKMYELKPWYGGSPYKQVYLYRVAGVKNKYGRQKQYVHKLVADAFLPKEKGKDFVHHKNSVENQNQVSNLERVTLETNLKLRKFFHRDEQGTVKRNAGFKKTKKGKDGENS